MEFLGPARHKCLVAAASFIVDRNLSIVPWVNVQVGLVGIQAGGDLGNKFGNRCPNLLRHKIGDLVGLTGTSLPGSSSGRHGSIRKEYMFHLSGLYTSLFTISL